MAFGRSERSMSYYSPVSGHKPAAHRVLFMWHTAHKTLLSSSCSCLMDGVSGETEPHPWAAGGLGWSPVLRSILSSSSFIHPFSTAASIDRNIYDVWLWGYNGVREHSGAHRKGRGKHAFSPWICSSPSSSFFVLIALILGTWMMLHFSESPPCF